MPSRFFDYDTDLLRSSRKKEKLPKTGYRRVADPNRVRRNSTSESSSNGTQRSSFSSGSSGMSSSSRRAAQYGSKSTGVLSNGSESHNWRDPLREVQVEPTAQVQEWAHQMHLTQQKKYWWCSSCYPKAPTLQVPSDKAMRRVRIVEPTHAYE